VVDQVFRPGAVFWPRTRIPGGGDGASRACGSMYGSMAGSSLAAEGRGGVGVGGVFPFAVLLGQRLSRGCAPARTFGNDQQALIVLLDSLLKRSRLQEVLTG